MPSSCCVVYCTSGYKSNTNKVSFFLFPKVTALKDKWIKAIPRDNLVVNDRTVVCEKHFTEDQIIKTWESGTGSNKIVINLRRPKLANDAIPCIFPGPKYLSKPVKKRNPPTKRMLEFESKTIKQVKEVIVEPTPNIISPNSEYFPEVIFNKIFENPTTTVILPEGWEYKTNGDKYPFVTYYFVSPYSDISFGVLVEKQISFGKDMVITCKIHNKLFDLKQFGITIPCSPLVTNITSLLNLLDGYNVCIGGPLEDKYPEIQNNIASIGLNQRFRHNKCPYLLNSKEQKKKSCLHCLHLNSAFRMKKKRMADGKKNILLLTPSKKQELITLRKDKHKIQKRVLRAKFRIKKLEAELNTAKESLSTMSYNSIEDLINKHKLNDSQSTMIKEIIAASKYKNPKNRRYSENWLLLCLLFHIRASGAYKFLRNQNLLPLPCTTSIRKYVNIVKTDCGFDDSFFKLLKKKMSLKTEKQRHGILLFDEVQLRKGLYVNTSNLTYSGLEDMGGEITTSEKKADHGLVLMFQSLADKFSQPIAVFASSGTVSGTVLAQLVLKAIVLLENSGCLIQGIICDGASTNRKMWAEFGISGHIDNVKNYFIHPMDDNRKVYTFSDVPHLFKNIRNRLHDKKVLRVNPDGNLIKWSHYIDVFNADIVHSGVARAIPKITKDHLFLSNVMKMRVRLMTQVFSHSMACGIEFYKRRNVSSLDNSDETQKFTVLLNNLFDSLNRRFPAEGIKEFGHDLKIMEDAEVWLNNWENCVINQHIHQNEFLTMTTAEGLRVTLRSTIELTKYLLSECGFDYVLTGKMNQDPLEKFFGMIRQAAGPNDHPTGPTFLHLYRILSLYSIIKPPKYGNCTILDKHAPKISVTEIKDIFQGDEENVRTNKLNDLQSKIDMLVEDGQWEADDIFEDHNYNSTTAIDCIVYYACYLFT